jgi:predicted RNA-binding protein with TRAM domain
MEHNRYGMSSMRTPPVKEGNTYTVKIESTGREGDGIAKIDGFVIFVPGAKVGEEIDVKINKVTRRVGFGEMVGSLTPDQPESEEISNEQETPDPEG